MTRARAEAASEDREERIRRGEAELIILDLTMPTMDGRAAFEELVRRTTRLVYSRLYLETGDPQQADHLQQRRVADPAAQAVLAGLRARRVQSNPLIRFANPRAPRVCAVWTPCRTPTGPPNP